MGGRKRGTGLGVAFAIFLMVASGLVGLASAGSAPPTPHVAPSTGTATASTPTVPATPTNVWAAIQSDLWHLPPAFRAELPPADSPKWLGAATFLADRPDLARQLFFSAARTEVAVHPAFGTGLSDGQTLLVLDGMGTLTTLIGGAVAINFALDAGICIAATAGWCAVAIAAILAVVLIYQYVTFTATGEAGVAPSAIPLSKTLYNSFESGIRTAEQGLQNTLSALNLSYIELQYEAASAAISQLGNATYNPPLDLVQSQIASQFATVGTAEEITESAWLGSTAYWFQAYNAATDGFQGGDSSCSMYLTSASSAAVNTSGTPNGGAYPPIAGSSAVAAGSDPQCYTLHVGATPPHWSYNFQPMSMVTLPTTVYVGQRDFAGYKLNTASTATFTFAPVQGGPWINVTLTSQVGQNLTTVPAGGYTISSVGGTVSILGLTVVVPLTVGSSTQIQMGTWVRETAYPAGTPTLGGFVPTTVSAGCGSVSCPTFPMYGLLGSATNLNAYLWAAETQAATLGQTYWSFLRGLGYTNPSAVPARCVVPNPASAFLAYGIPVSQMAKMNYTSMLAVYYSYLLALGYTFNPDGPLNTLNFCGKHVVIQQAGQFPWLSFTQYNASGSIYIPNATSSTGATQHFGVVASWNVSNAQLVIMPSLLNFTVSLNTTWLASEKNPLNVVYDSHAGTNRSLVGYIGATGNSSLAGGSAYPTSIDPKGGVGEAFYITSCVVNKTWTNPCNFYHGTFTSNGTYTNCGNLTTQATAECSTAGGGAPAATTSCGGTIPIFSQVVNSLFGFFGNLLGLGCPLALLVGGIISVVIVIVILVVLVYAVRVGYSAARGKDE